MRYILIAVFAINVHISFSQCGNRYKTDLFSVDTASYTYGENYTYNNILQTLRLDLYLPHGDTFKQRPCVIFCFGGAFIQGDKKSTELVYFSRLLSQKGFVCASIDYRLDNSANMSANGESGAIIRAVQDAKAAIRFLKSKSTELGIDTTNFFIGGTSAGGVTAITLGYSQYSDFPSYIQSKIDSLGGWEGHSNILTNTSTVKGLFNFSGAILDTIHIGAGDLPIYLNHATQDATVPFYSGYPLNGQSTTLMHGSGNIAKRMKNLGNYYSIDSFQSSAHPAFATTDFSVLITTTENLRKFLYKIVGCDNVSSSIVENEVTEIQIPNPVSNTIYLPTVNKDIDVSLYNLLGTKLLERKTKENRIDISQYSNGIYFLKYNQQIIKLIKE